MTLETFFEKFDLFADAPDAVTKMRQLVLHLAVTGKLVPQDPKDEPAEQFLALIQKNRGKAKALRSPGIDADGTESPKSFDLPVGWSWARFPELGVFGRGKSKHRPRNDHSLFIGGTHRLVQTGDVARANGTIQTHTGLYNEIGLAQSKMWPAGTLCITIAANIADSGILGFDACFPDSVVGFIPAEPIPTVRYFEYFIRTAKEHLEQFAPSTAQKNINLGILEQVWIPIPPLAEQKRIVAKVDELMALCDRLEAQQQERTTRHADLARASLARFADAPTPANLAFLFHPSYTIPPADLRKSILTLAVQGKLVPQDPEDEPAEESFPKLASRAIASDDDAYPRHWLRVPLGEIGEWRGGGTPSKSRPDFWTGDLPWVSPKDMKVLHIADAQDHISPAAVEGSSVRLIPPGSLVMVVRGMILARAFPVALTMREVTINQDMKALLPSEPKTKEYLLVALRAFEPDVLAAIEHSSHGTCKLKTEFLQDFVMPLPPLAEQRRIVAKVDQLMALVDQLETQLAASRAAAANLLSALVAELTAT